MASYVKFELEDGTVVYIETADVPKGSSGLIPSAKSAEEQTAVSFEKSVTTVRKMAASMLQNLREGFNQQPEEIQINFGLKASTELGNLVVARGGVEANYNVMLRWRNESKKDSDTDDKQDEAKA